MYAFREGGWGRDGNNASFLKKNANTLLKKWFYVFLGVKR